MFIFTSLRLSFLLIKEKTIDEKCIEVLLRIFHRKPSVNRKKKREHSINVNKLDQMKIERLKKY